jgi:hypothetical protein
MGGRARSTGRECVDDGLFSTRISTGETEWALGRPGTFGNDGSLDYVGDLIDQLTSTVVGCFKNDNADLDEGGESELMPSVAIIKILSEDAGHDFKPSRQKEPVLGSFQIRPSVGFHIWRELISFRGEGVWSCW